MLIDSMNEGVIGKAVVAFVRHRAARQRILAEIMTDIESAHQVMSYPNHSASRLASIRCVQLRTKLAKYVKEANECTHLHAALEHAGVNLESDSSGSAMTIVK